MLALDEKLTVRHQDNLCKSHSWWTTRRKQWRGRGSSSCGTPNAWIQCWETATGRPKRLSTAFTCRISLCSRRDYPFGRILSHTFSTRRWPNSARPTRTSPASSSARSVSSRSACTLPRPCVACKQPIPCWTVLGNAIAPPCESIWLCTNLLEESCPSNPSSSSPRRGSTSICSIGRRSQLTRSAWSSAKHGCNTTGECTRSSSESLRIFSLSRFPWPPQQPVWSLHIDLVWRCSRRCLTLGPSMSN